MKKDTDYVVGITTFNREESFLKVFESIKSSNPKKIIVAQDSTKTHPYSEELVSQLKRDSLVEYIPFEDKSGVGILKDSIIEHFKSMDLQHLFLVEDDVIVKYNRVFGYCIMYSEQSGMCHFNWNVSDDNPILYSFNYGTCADSRYDTVITKNVKGHFSYFNKKSLDSIEFDTNYTNAFEHIDVEMQLIDKGLLPPFWAFASPRNLGQYLEQNDVESTITNKDGYGENYRKSLNHWISKWGGNVDTIENPKFHDIKRSVCLINKRHGVYGGNLNRKIPNDPVSIICTIKDRFCVRYNSVNDFLPHEVKLFRSHDMKIVNGVNQNSPVNIFKTNQEIFNEKNEFYPFTNFLKSIKKQAFRVDFDVELIVVDWSSKDGNVDEEVEFIWDQDYKIVKLPYEEKFSKGYALRKGLEAATHEKVHFTDVDIKYTNPDFLEECSLLKDDEAIFPIVAKETTPSSLYLYMEVLGYGLASLTKTLYNKTDGHPDIRQWGKEDSIFAERVEKVIGHDKFRRPLYRGCIHQFHTDKTRNTK